HGRISRSMRVVNSVSEFGFRRAVTLRATNVNLPGLSQAFLRWDPRLHNAAYGSASQHPNVTLMAMKYICSQLRFFTGSQQMRCAISRVVRPQAARSDQKLCLHPPGKTPPKQSLDGARSRNQNTMGWNTGPA